MGWPTVNFYTEYQGQNLQIFKNKPLHIISSLYLWRLPGEFGGLPIQENQYTFVKITLMLPEVKQIADEFKAELKKVYASELAGLILFGSYARGDYHQESDIDFAIVLNNPTIYPASEIMRTSAISTELSLKYGKALSAFPTTINKMQTSMQSVFQAIRKEGVII